MNLDMIFFGMCLALPFTVMIAIALHFLWIAFRRKDCDTPR